MGDRDLAGPAEQQRAAAQHAPIGADEDRLAAGGDEPIARLRLDEMRGLAGCAIEALDGPARRERLITLGRRDDARGGGFIGEIDEPERAGALETARQRGAVGEGGEEARLLRRREGGEAARKIERQRAGAVEGERLRGEGRDNAGI